MAARIVLASGSATRATLLRNAGVAFDVHPADVDERLIEAPLLAAGKGPRDVAGALADAKALAVGRLHPDALVIGADQTLDLDGRLFTKPADRAAAHRQLSALSGRTHHLHTAVAGVRGGEVVWRAVESPALTMRSLSSGEIDAYIERAGAGVLGSVGAYQLEGLGIQLFERIDGQYFAILGLSLLPVLGWLRSEGTLD